jgi:hypothetical protein
LNTWTASEDRLVSEEDLEAAAILDGPLDAEPGVKYVVTIDIGLKNDRTVVAVCHAAPIGTTPGAPKLIVVDRLIRWQGKRLKPVNLAEVEDAIALASAQYNGAPAHFDPWQSAGLQQRLKARGVKTEEFTFTQASVGHIASALYTALRNRWISLPNDPDLLSELGNVRLKSVGHGVVRIDHDSGQHDDQAVTIAMAVALLQDAKPGSGPWIEWMKQRIAANKGLSDLAAEAEQARREQLSHLPRLGEEQQTDRAKPHPRCQHRWQKWPDGWECCIGDCKGWRESPN